MKRLFLSLLALISMFAVTVQADQVWKVGDALLTEGSQITSNNSQDGFPPSNLLRPESEGYGTNQIIWHSAWTPAAPAGTDTYLQTSFGKPVQHIIFTMIGSMWQQTYDTPTEMIIYATNDPSGEWTEITHLTHMENDYTAFRPDRYTSPHIDLGAEYSYVRFLVKKTMNDGASYRQDGNGNYYVSLGRFQVYEAYLGEEDPVKPTWVKDTALLTEDSQITSNNSQDGFPPSNLLRPESEGYATNQIIWHSARTPAAPAGTETYLQTHFASAQQHIIFTMIGSMWASTYDTPTEMVLYATNDPSGEWTEITTLTEMSADFTSFSPDMYESPHIDLGAEYTDLRFVVKKTMTYSSTVRHDANGNPYVSLGRFQVYSAKEAGDDPIDPKDNINLLFIGNSITYGATLGSPASQAPPILCRAMIQEATGVTTNVYNGGNSGITTLGFLPGRTDFTMVLNSARTFVKQNGGLTYFSIMLGTNDSACSGPEGSPVSPATYAANIRKIINALIEAIPSCKIVLNYPIWYSPNTHNGAVYLQEGLDRLHSYYPVIDEVVEEYDQVYAGDRGVWEYFEDNKTLFTDEPGNSGNFCLHPNQYGAKRLAEIWSRSLLKIIEADGVEIKNPIADWPEFKPAADKKYTISTPRGTYGTKDGLLTNTVRQGIGATEGEFAFITYEGQTYLYSVADQSFLFRDPVPYQDNWSNMRLSNQSFVPIKVNYTGISSAYPYTIASEGYIANTANNTQTGVCFNTYISPNDGGNQTAITEAGDFDTSEAYAMLENFFTNQVEVLYCVVDSDGNALDSVYLAGAAGTLIDQAPSALPRKAYTDYSVPEPVTLQKEGDNVVNVLATWRLPFELSPDRDNAHWYNLALREGCDYVTTNNAYKCNPDATKEDLESTTYQWAFDGNPYEGIVVYCRVNPAMTLTRVNNKAFLRNGIFRWQIIESTQGFLLATDDKTYPYMNEYGGAGGSLGFWNNISDVGSIFSVCEVGVPNVSNIKLSTGGSLKIFRAPDDKANGRAILVFPGGGYGFIAGPNEGSDWAPMFNNLGYTVGVLTYTVPPSSPDQPLTQARAAMSYLRSHSDEWNVNTGIIGVIGFSAGGHLAATVATHTSGGEAPAFQILFYPVITMDASYTHSGSRQNLIGDNPTLELETLYSNEKQVTSTTPPAYICWADNDGTVPPANSINYASALTEKGVPVRTRNYPSGGHGYGYGITSGWEYHDDMVADLTAWLLGLEDDLTAVNGIPRASATKAPAYYNLYGQRVSEPRQGIYITEGKKIRIK
ncbi:MAG: alpha/beta hydrolase fold domain-containing protein [Bacteroidaceae bacterium]|nr:alpha/beta hydrolase fold domain-containing protein [Bacteroidaceae bacterium]